jgi:pentatricopeptide repeat protein
VHTFNALIDAADAARDWGAALRVHTAMRVAGVAPNAATHALMVAVGQRGANDVAAAQSRLAAVSAAAAALAAALIQKGLL